MCTYLHGLLGNSICYFHRSIMPLSTIILTRSVISFAAKFRNSMRSAALTEWQNLAA